MTSAMTIGPRGLTLQVSKLSLYFISYLNHCDQQFILLSPGYASRGSIEPAYFILPSRSPCHLIRFKRCLLELGRNSSSAKVKYLSRISPSDTQNVPPLTPFNLARGLPLFMDLHCSFWPPVREKVEVISLSSWPPSPRLAASCHPTYPSSPGSAHLSRTERHCLWCNPLQSTSFEFTAAVPDFRFSPATAQMTAQVRGLTYTRL